MKIQVTRRGATVSGPSRLRVPDAPSEAFAAAPAAAPGAAPVAATPRTPAAASPAPAPRVSAFPLEFATTMMRDDTGAGIKVIISAAAPGSLAGPLAVTLGVTDDAGTIIKSGATQFRAAAGEDYQGTFSANVPPGRYHVRVAATGASGVAGWLDRDVVAALTPMGAMSASGILMAWAGADQVFHGWTLERIPASAESLLATMELYPPDGSGAAAAPALEFSIVSATGQRVLVDELPTRMEGSRLTATATVPLAQLLPGRYEVRIEAASEGKVVGTVSTYVEIGTSVEAGPARPPAE
jgi:hypothetical protein